MNAAHRAGTTKDAKECLCDMLDSPFCFLAGFGLVGRDAVHSSIQSPGEYAGKAKSPTSGVIGLASIPQS
jgi:hypothetical protein